MTNVKRIAKAYRQAQKDMELIDVVYCWVDDTRVMTRREWRRTLKRLRAQQ